jgi:hypothetical protein
MVAVITRAQQISMDEAWKNQVTDTLTQLTNTLHGLDVQQTGMNTSVTHLQDNMNTGTSKVPIFYGFSSEDPANWLRRFKENGAFRGWNDQKLRDGFPLSLAGPSEIWFTNLPAADKATFADIEAIFNTHFSTNDLK